MQGATAVLLAFAMQQPIADDMLNDKQVDKYSLQAEYQKHKEYQKEKNCLMSALWHESRGEGEQGIKAVASVIENRKQHEDYPSSYCRIIKQPWQFSFVNEGKPLTNPERLARPSEKEVLARISDIADRMLQGRFKSILPSSVLWYTTVQIRPSWSRSMKVAARIGQHRFYLK